MIKCSPGEKINEFSCLLILSSEISGCIFKFLPKPLTKNVWKELNKTHCVILRIFNLYFHFLHIFIWDFQERHPRVDSPVVFSFVDGFLKTYFQRLESFYALHMCTLKRRDKPVYTKRTRCIPWKHIELPLYSNRNHLFWFSVVDTKHSISVLHIVYSLSSKEFSPFSLQPKKILPVF